MYSVSDENSSMKQLIIIIRSEMLFVDRVFFGFNSFHSRSFHQQIGYPLLSPTTSPAWIPGDNQLAVSAGTDTTAAPLDW